MSAPARDILAERAEIDRAVAGKTIPSVLRDTAAAYPDLAALRWRETDGWRTLTWAAYRERVRDATLGLLALGFAPGEFGLIMARNRPEHLIADLALTHAGGRSVSIYNTLAPEQIAYIANHCGATVAFVEDREFLRAFQAIRAQTPRLRHIVLIEGEPDDDSWITGWQALLAAGQTAALDDPAAFDGAWMRVQPGDVVSLIYTSGTTGAPKGVTYTHSNILWTCASSARLVQYQPGERFVSYLPLAHVAERFTTHWGGLYNAITNHLVPDTTLLLASLLEIRPQVFVGVPRVWEKFQTGIQLGIAAEPDAARRALAEQAIAIGRQVVEREQRGEAVPPDLAAAGERLAPVRRMILGRIGLDECRVAYTSTAPTPLDVLLFFAGLGLPIYEVWGMSELTGPATSNRIGAARYGTVGVTLAGVEARLAEDGELLVRGGNVTPGYYRDVERTAEAFGPDGWLRTGDLATVDDAGYYRIVDRKKELLITSYGKNIAPSAVEALLRHHPLIGQAMAVGDARQYICALLVLDHEALAAWARARGLTGAPEELAAHPLVVEEVRGAVAAANTHLSHPEQVKRFLILPAEWTPASEELTPTLKLRRRVVERKYADAIASLYASPPAGYAADPAAQPGASAPLTPAAARDDAV